MSTLIGTPTGIRIAVALGLSGSAWCSGSIIGTSLIAGAALVDPGPSAARAYAVYIWNSLYDRGKKAMPPIAASTAAAFAYAAYYIPNPLSLDSVKRTRNLFVLAGLLTVSIVPYTFLTMMPTNKSLMARSNAVKAKSELKGVAETVQEDEETIELLKKWNVLNTGRGLLPLAGAVVGIVAVFF